MDGAKIRVQPGSGLGLNYAVKWVQGQKYRSARFTEAAMGVFMISRLFYFMPTG